jgi:bacillithiol biosynthesis cysteine-adding enzyme BshC
MVRENIPLEQTGFFNRLILDLISGKDAVKPFYGLHHTVESYAAKMHERSTFPLDRATLVDVLIDQYEAIGRAKDAVLSNINALRDDRTFTITTGHQLNIFTGPLYFVYKILHTIRLAEELQKHYPDNRFVPVYWMATEDHDLAEISFFHLFGKKYEWNTTQTGATGRMETTGLSDICDELEQVFASQPQGLKLVNLFREAYAQKTLAQATRHLANALFGHYGLVVVDGDNAALKSRFADAMLRDAFNGEAFEAVKTTSRQLSELDYHTQINPREINLFYLADGVRERIVRTDTGFYVLHTELRFTDDALRSEMKAHPEKFSPNVVLRPMYQECVLPNLAYIGGAGELAYWLQLKEAFTAMGFSYPVLVLRNHLLLIDGAHHLQAHGRTEPCAARPFPSRGRPYPRPRIGDRGGRHGPDGRATTAHGDLRKAEDHRVRNRCHASGRARCRTDQTAADHRSVGQPILPRAQKEERDIGGAHPQAARKVVSQWFTAGTVTTTMMQFRTKDGSELIAALHGCIQPFDADLGVVSV